MKVSFSPFPPPFPPSLPAFPLSLPPSPPFLPQVPTWHFNGFDYPYYNVEMIDGSSCDIRGNNPRSVSILYICQTDAPTLGMVCVYVHICKYLCMFVPTHLSYYVLYTYFQLLLVEEASTCHYVAITGTKQLCQNRSYKYVTLQNKNQKRELLPQIRKL